MFLRIFREASDKEFFKKTLLIITVFQILYLILPFIAYFFREPSLPFLVDYVLQLVSIALFSFFLGFLMNIYLNCYREKYRFQDLPSTVLSLRSVLYLLFILFIYNLIHGLIVYDIVVTNGSHTVITVSYRIWALLSIFTTLIYHSILPIYYILCKRKVFREKSCLRKIYVLFNIVWRLRGGFVIYIFFGFMVVNLIGFLMDFGFNVTYYLFSMPLITPLVLFFKILGYSIIIYLYFKYFVRDYMIDVIDYLHKYRFREEYRDQVSQQDP